MAADVRNAVDGGAGALRPAQPGRATADADADHRRRRRGALPDRRQRRPCGRDPRGDPRQRRRLPGRARHRPLRHLLRRLRARQPGRAGLVRASPVRPPLVLTGLGPLHVQDRGPADGAVALLWPSLFSDGPTSWDPQLPVLHELGWRTLLVDPPGAGQSPPATRLFTMEECAEAAVAVIDAAGVDRAALLGLSWGGFVALRVAIATPQRVTALVLSNTSARRMSPRERRRDRLLSSIVRLGIPGGPGRLVVAGMLSEDSRR